MGWSRKSAVRDRAAVRSARRSRPTLEAMEGRQVLSTMVPNYNGVTGVAGGSAWHWQQNGGWTNPGGIGIVSLITSKDQFGGDQLFARVKNNGVWSYSYATGQWKDTGALADSMIAATNGVHLLAGGSVWHYQDNGGLSRLGGVGVTAIVDSHDQKGQEVVYARLSNASVWSYTMHNAQWKDTGGQVDSMIAAADGIHGIAGGALWHYQMVGGWTKAGGIGVTSIVDSRNALGQDQVFTRLVDSSIWSYTFATGQWKNTGGRLDTMIANANGISGTNFGSAGYLWHYQDDTGWTNTGGIQVASVVTSYNQFRQEQMFARFNDRTVRAYDLNTGTWTNNLGSFD